jgi:D-glycero-D-manno-heptose 1,7-bisphosphate phosphatase
MKLIILDRDGVINQDSDQYVRCVDEWIAIPGSLQAIADLSNAGYTIAIATNQSGISRGYYSLDTLDAMHQKMQQLVKEAGGLVDHIAFCPHVDADECQCRKPLPGMLGDLLLTTGALPYRTWMVGDSLRDLQAAWALDIDTALVKTGKGEKTLLNPDLKSSTPIFRDLAHFSQFLLHDEPALEPPTGIIK